MDKITPSREAPTVTTAKGMSIGYVSVFILATVTDVSWPVDGSALSGHLLWAIVAWTENQ